MEVTVAPKRLIKGLVLIGKLSTGNGWISLIRLNQELSNSNIPELTLDDFVISLYLLDLISVKHKQNIPIPIKDEHATPGDSDWKIPNSIDDTHTKINCLTSILQSDDLKQNGVLARNVYIRLKLVPSKCLKSEFCYRCCQSRQVIKCSNCWRSYHSGCSPDKWIRPGDMKSRTLVLTCENCTSKGEIIYDENLQYLMDKDSSSGIISTLIGQPNYLLDVLIIEKTELKYLASPAAIRSNTNRVNVTRLFDILFYHHLIFGNSTDSYSILEELTNRIQIGLNQKTFSRDRIWPKARYQKGFQTMTDDKRTDEGKENDLHCVINKLQTSKLNDLSDRNSNSEIGNKVANTLLSRAADYMEDAKLNQMKNIKLNPDITPCFKCGNRAKYSSECGCRIHSVCPGHKFAHFLVTKRETKISEYSQNKTNNHKRESRSLLISIIKKKSVAGWELDLAEKQILKKNIQQMKVGWEPPRQLPKLSHHVVFDAFCSNKQLPNHQTQDFNAGLKLNVSAPSGKKGRGRLRKRKRSERLTDSEEESEEEVV